MKNKINRSFLFLFIPTLWIGPDYFDVALNEPFEVVSEIYPSEEEYNPARKDLEEEEQEFVLEVKQIKIPDFPHAFNPSIVRWKDSLLLSFRIYNQQTGFPNQIGLVRLDENFDLIGSPQILEMKIDDPLSLYKRQDPRLIVLGDRLFMAYNNQLRTIVDREIRRMLITEVFEEGGRFYSETPIHLAHFEGENSIRTQKNWVPFEYQNEILFSYSLSPHKVMRPIPYTDECETFCTSETPPCWDYGVLRGGTPALKVGDEYLSFFHSSINLPSKHSNGKVMIHYFMGAYTFSKDPPFSIEKISPRPIVGKNFYEGITHRTWKPLRVVFPGGFVFDDQFIWVVYGRQDHEVWVVKLDRNKLMNSLIPLETAQ